MNNVPEQLTPGPTTTDKRVKMVSIMVQFLADNDEEALVVKQAVSKALGDRPNTRVNFTIMDQHGPHE
jgi:hypothetical protein